MIVTVDSRFDFSLATKSNVNIANNMRDFDIDKICRVCLESNTELTLLFDEQNAVDGVSLPDMISECTVYKALRHDDFPHLICLVCKEKLLSAYNFKKQYEYSHRTLVAFLESINKLTVDMASYIANDKAIQTDESTLYPCEKCSEKFMSYERLREHRLTAHRGTENLCRLCSKKFNRIADLKNHMAVLHPEIGHITSNECAVCKRKFTRKEHVTRHMRTVHRFIAEQCDAGVVEMKTDGNENETLIEAEIDYGNMSHARPDVELLSNCDAAEYLAMDSSPFTAENPFSSDDDGKPLSDLLPNKSSSKDISDLFVKLEPVDLNNQVDISYAAESVGVKQEVIPFDIKRAYKCSECEKTFTRSSHVKRHLLSHRQERPFSCTICEQRFKRADHLKLHLTKHDENKRFHCDGCDRSYCRADLLKRHKEQKHRSDKLLTSDVCKLCNKSFSSKTYLRKHMRLHTDKNWKCKWCSFDFDSKEALKQHTKSHNQEKPYLCSECGLRFVRNDYLLIHMRRHKGEKPYKCRYCDKGFTRATDLNLHERYHTGEKTHLCTTCGKGFQRAYNLGVHMRVHTGERPYQCPHCLKNFAQCNDLKVHIRRHTGERIKCELCGIGFVQMYKLTHHKLSVHGIEIESRNRRVTKVPIKDLTIVSNQ